MGQIRRGPGASPALEQLEQVAMQPRFPYTVIQAYQHICCVPGVDDGDAELVNRFLALYHGTMPWRAMPSRALPSLAIMINRVRVRFTESDMERTRFMPTHGYALDQENS